MEMVVFVSLLTLLAVLSLLFGADSRDSARNWW